MNDIREITKKIKVRLLVNSVLFVVLLFLAGLAFYFFYTSAPFIPLILAVVSAIPAGVVIDELRQLPKIKKLQQPHYPPQRSGK